MAKTDATRQRTRKSKVVTDEVIEQENNINTEEQTESVPSSEQIVTKEEDAPAENTEMKQEEKNQDAQDSQMDTTIEVKGNQSTVTVCWDKNEGVDVDEKDKTIDESGQMMDSGEPAVSSVDVVGPTEDASSENTETESQTGAIAAENESAPAIIVTWEEKNEDGESSDIKKETNGGEPTVVKEKAVKGKRKAQSADETSPIKKTKLINDGFCLFVGNLNNSKKLEEVKDSLANYFMKQSLLVQDIRLDRSKKHAYVDLASEMDLTKALTLNGETILDKPIRIEKAKIKSEDKVKRKASAEDKKAEKDSRCLFLKNIPYSATKEDIMKIFRKAVAVRFPGGAESPDKGIAFVEFKNKAIAEKLQQRKRVIKIQGRVLIVDSVKQANVPKATNANDDNNNTKAEAPPNNTLFVSNLPFGVKEKTLKKIFQKAVTVTIPRSKGKARGFAFVEFATVAEAEKALNASQSIKISKREVGVQFYEMQEKPKVLSNTLIVMDLAEKTTAETLKEAFEGALSARVAVDKKTGVSKRFGFVEFEKDETCKTVKEAMEDCEIDGSKVTVAYAKSKSNKDPTGAKKGQAGCPGGQPAGLRRADRQRSRRQQRRNLAESINVGRRRRGAGKPQDAVKQVENKDQQL